MTGEQLTFDLNLDAASARLADRLRDRRQIPSGGAERLLRELTRRGLDERAVIAAAALALELDNAGRREAS